jgi:transcriptional regulator
MATVLRVLRENPLVWVIATGAQQPPDAKAPPLGTMLPIVPVAGADGEVTALVGHFAKRNPQVARLRENPRALILAQGVNGYISPSWLRDRTRAPTWNYVGIQFIVDIEFFETPEAIGAHLRELVDINEAGRANAWSVDEMGARYQSLAKGVAGFTARIVETRAKFKLGQDERDAEYHDITVALDAAGGGPLLEWIRAFNPGRT